MPGKGKSSRSGSSEPSRPAAGLPLVALSLDEESVARLVPVEADRQLVGVLSQAIQAAPIITAATAGRGYYRVMLDEGYELTDAGGGLFWGHAREGNRFAKHAKLAKVRPTPSQLGAVAFQLVSIVVAQAHLADINKNLKALKASVDKLHARLDGKDSALIFAAFKKIQEQARGIYLGELGPDACQLLVNAEEKLTELQLDLVRRLNEDLLEFEGLKDEAWFGVGDYLETVEQQAAHCLGITRLLLACISVREGANNLLRILGSPSHEQESRRACMADADTAVEDALRRVEVATQRHLSKAANTPVAKLADSKRAAATVIPILVPTGPLIPAVAFVATKVAGETRLKTVEATGKRLTARIEGIREITEQRQASGGYDVIASVEDGRVSGLFSRNIEARATA